MPMVLIRAKAVTLIRLASRNLRGGFAGFRIFISCIALGVAAITGIGSIAQSLADVEAITLDDVHRILAAWPLDAPAATVVAGPGA